MDRSLPSPARWTAPHPAARRTSPLRRLGAALAAAWHRCTMDADERFLRGARDLSDLERRLAALERSGSAGALPPELWG